MPHLSPLQWSYLPLWPILILLIVGVLIWWQQTPNFPNISSQNTSPFTTWNWW